MNYKEIDEKLAKLAFEKTEDEPENNNSGQSALVGEPKSAVVPEVDLSEPLFPAQPVHEPTKTLSSSNRDFLLSVPALADRLALNRIYMDGYCIQLVSGGYWVVVYRVFLALLSFLLLCLGLYYLACGNPNEFIMSLLHETPERFYLIEGSANPQIDWRAIIVGSLLLIGRIFAMRASNEEKGAFPNKFSRISFEVAVIGWIGVILFQGASSGTFTNCVCIWSVCICMVSLTLAFFSSVRFANRKTTNELASMVRLNENGLVFGWLSKNELLAPIVPWSAVRRVASESLPLNSKYPGGDDATASAMLVIDIDSTEIENFKEFLGLTNSFVSCWKLDEGRLFALPAGLARIHFPLASLSLESERPLFLEAFRQHLSVEVQDDKFKALIKDGPKGSSFTRLWLDEANRTRRRNNDELGAGATLLEGRYKIESKLASGGQATVYRGKDNLFGQSVVAIKEFVLPDGGGVGTRSRSVDSISHEAQLLAAFEHSAIPKILDNFIEDGRAYLVFEFIEGRSLRQIVQEDGCFAADKVIAIGRDLAAILSYMHSMTPPIVHRDLSPDNLMLGDDGRLVLIDFNVAEQLESNATKTVVGKHHYMAPEQFKGKPCPQSDLYSMGGCLYYLATGNDPRPLTVSKLPENLLNPTSDAEASDAQDGARAENLRKLDGIIRKLTALSLDERYGSAAQFLADSDSIAATAETA